MFAAGKGIKKAAIALAFLCFAFVIACVIADAVFSMRGVSKNWHDPNTRFDPRIGWSPVPNRHIQNEWGNVSSNSSGFRSEEIDQNKKQIIVLGDSVAWGYGVDDRETMPYHLGRLLQPLDYQVDNLGVSGYDIGQYYMFLKSQLGKFKNLKYVVLVLCGENDFADTITNEAYGKRKPLYRVKGKELVLTNSPISRLDLRNLFSTSRTIQELTCRYAKIGGFLDSLTGNKVLDREEGEKVVSALLRKIYYLLSENNVRLIVLVSPDMGDFSEKSRDLIWFENFFQTERNYYARVDYYEALRSHSGDLEQIYTDDLHYSNYGNKLLAETIAGYIK
jgi:lysophospholipase L1-like esterase